MILALQGLPLVLLLLLLGTGRATPVGACLIALAAALPAAWVSLPAGGDLPGLLARELPRGLYLALPPIGVVAGGLLFHAALAAPAGAPQRPATPARVFALALPLGVFLESVTGFAVGAVFALASLRGMGIRGPVAGALALQALVMVPWGGLGPGTALGAALAQQPGNAISALAALPSAAWLVLLAPLLWSLSARVGVPVPGREKAVQVALLVLLAALLVLATRLLPFELAGVLASAPVAVLALWRADPPRALGVALRRAAPYLLLVGALLAARLWPRPPALYPFAELPGLPLTHVAVVLWLVALLLLLRQGDGGVRARQALARAQRPALAIALYVVLGRLLAGSGVAAALAQAGAAALGPFAPYAIAPIGLLAGLVTGSGVGANAALMPVQVALGAQAGLPPLLAPAVQVFASSAGAGMSVGVTAMLCGLLGDGTRPAQLWRLLAPSILAVLLLAWLTLAFAPLP